MSDFKVGPVGAPYKPTWRDKRRERPPDKQAGGKGFQDMFRRELERQVRHVGGSLDVPSETRSMGEDGLKF